LLEMAVVVEGQVFRSELHVEISVTQRNGGMLQELPFPLALVCDLQVECLRGEVVVDSTGDSVFALMGA
jgi:hypothetical protein